MTLTEAMSHVNAWLRQDDDPEHPRYHTLTPKERESLVKLLGLAHTALWGERKAPLR